MEKCIYCGQIITKKNSEHIIPNSIGGLLEADNIICIDCNSNFGETIEASFAEQFNSFRVVLGILSGRGKKAPRLKGLNSESGEKYDLSHGGVPSLSDPKISTWDDGKGVKHVKRILRSKEEQKKIMKKIDPEKIVYINYKEVSKHVEEMITIDSSIGGDETFRCITKTGMNLLAHLFGNNFILENKFESARNYVLSGEKQTTEITSYFGFTDYRLPDLITYGVNHSVIVFNEQEKVKSLVILFGNIQFGCVLGETNLPNSFFYFVNPIVREHYLGIYPFSIKLEDLNQAKHIHRNGKIYDIFKRWVDNILNYCKNHKEMDVIKKDLTEFVNEKLIELATIRSVLPEEICDTDIKKLVKDAWEEIKIKYNISYDEKN